MPRKDLIQVRRDLSNTWNSVNPILAPGEIGHETDTGRIKIGDGTSTWEDLEYSGGGVIGQLDGGAPDSIYGGIPKIDAGGVE